MEKKFKIYYTSDTHGYLFPTDYVSKTDVKKDMGVLSCAQNFSKDGNTLIIDGGDTIQGSAFAKYMWENEKEGCTISEVFNKAGYDYVTLGNHDFNNDYSGILEYLGSLDAQCVLGNVIDQKGDLGLKPYVIHTLENGLRLGIVGLVTSYVSLWEKPEHLKYLTIQDTFERAASLLEEVKPQCDVTICIYHGGFEADLGTGKILETSKENVGYRICKELDYDLLLTGHQHMFIEGRDLFGTFTLQLPSNAVRYAEIEVKVKDGKKQFRSESKMPKAINAEEIPEKWANMQADVQKWLDRKAGSFDEEILPLSKLEVALQGSKLADFCNQVQMEYTGADFSCTSLGNNPIGFEKEVTARDIMAAYQFPNTIKVLEVDEAVIKKALERVAQYYTLKDGKVTISECFIHPKIEHYNYDFFAGLEYVMDIRKPVGQRVISMTVNGKPLEKRKYTLAMSDYRATGTGGYDVYKSCKLVKEYGVDIQELVLEYVRSHKCVKLKNGNNFRVEY